MAKFTSSLRLLIALCAVALSESACRGTLGALGDALKTADAGETPTVDAGCGTSAAVLDAQRLTKLEYNNVIRDLFGVSGDFSALFAEPAKGAAGFSTESAAQTLSPTIVLEFYRAADAVVQAVFAQTPNPLLACSADAGQSAGMPPIADGGRKLSDCTSTAIVDLATRAFRRAPTAEEKAQLIGLYQSASSGLPDDGMKLVVSGILLSPQFLFRTTDLTVACGAPVPLTGVEMASRLSFFIWGSIPDEALLKAAANGDLTLEAGIEGEVRRMLKSPKSAYLAQFASQWLQLEKLDTQVRSAQRFPLWSPVTVSAMKDETLDFIKNMVSADESVIDIVNGRYTFIDQRLAPVYGLADSVKKPMRVELTDGHRTGILTHASVMSMTSVGDVSSPVRRGFFVLQKILCSPPPPPPANVPALDEDPDAGSFLGESEIRQRLAKHRTHGPSCTGCHLAMDPIGLSYESYDAIGAFRTKYPNDAAVDATGVLPTGERLSNALDLVPLLKEDVRFKLCFTVQLASFAHGRDVTTVRDQCSMEALAVSAIGEQKRFSDLVVAIALDPNFRNRASE